MEVKENIIICNLQVQRSYNLIQLFWIFLGFVLLQTIFLNLKVLSPKWLVDLEWPQKWRIWRSWIRTRRWSKSWLIPSMLSWHPRWVPQKQRHVFFCFAVWQAGGVEHAKKTECLIGTCKLYKLEVISPLPGCWWQVKFLFFCGSLLRTKNESLMFTGILGRVEHLFQVLIPQIPRLLGPGLNKACRSVVTRLYGLLVTESVHFFHQNQWSNSFIGIIGTHLFPPWKEVSSTCLRRLASSLPWSNTVTTSRRRPWETTRCVSCRLQPTDPPGGNRRSRRCEVRWSFSWRRWGWLGDWVTHWRCVLKVFSPTFFCGGIFSGKTTHLAWIKTPVS